MNEQLMRQCALLNTATARALIVAMGMQAENMQREHCGSAMAYTSADFMRLIEDEGLGVNDAIGALQA